MALTAGELAEGAVGAIAQPDRRQRVERLAALGPAGAPPPGQPREHPHQGDVQRADRVVEARALGLRDGARAGAETQLAGRRRELAEQHTEQGGLPAAVGSQQGDPPAGGRGERDALDRRWAAAAVAGGEVPRARQHFRAHPMPGIAQPRAPPVKPRTIASALACSMVTYDAPADPLGPSVSP